MSLVVTTILLMAATYFMQPARESPSWLHLFRKKTTNPFQGRHVNQSPSPGKIVNKGAMTRCHNCATFFPEHRVVRDVVEGHILEFCSTNCRNAFLRPND